jgi:pimeloyl-ACP methyl ester carboxylesterase
MPATGRLRYLESLPPPAHAQRRRGALVLLHAFPLNARMWEPQLGLAALGWHVIAPQVRGVDGGDAEPPAATLDDYTADLIDLLDQLHIEDAVFCGLSMGGYLALSLLRRAPTYIRALVLADTRSEADTPEGREARLATLKKLDHEGPGVVVDELIPRLLGAGTRAHRPAVVERVRELAMSNSKDSLAAAVRVLMSRLDATPLLSTIHFPTLIIVGEDDVITPPAAAEHMHSRIAGAELVRISDCGHLSSLERPDAFNDALARFLNHRV